MGIKPIEMRFTILIERNEEGSYTVTVPSLPGCITQGDTWEEAISNAREAIVGYIEALKALGKSIPLEIPVEIEAGAIL
jgi:predicted RNase H-like HicB family nuclease